MDDSNNKLCEEFRNDVWLYMDNSLNATQKQCWDSHLKDCANCSGLLKSNTKTTILYNKIPNDDLADATFKRIIHKAAETENQTFLIPRTQSNRSLFEIFGFYKLAFGGTILVTALVLIFITFFKNPELPEIKTDLPRQVLEWNDNQMDNRLEKVGDQIYSLRTDDWDIYLIRRKKKENWNKALSSIQKQIRQMQKEVASTSM